jgi:aminoglycoside/choline kinase family phosphotransferase
MLTTIDKIRELFIAFSKASISSIDKLPQAGSERHYFRLHTSDGSYIATHGANIKENESFIYFSKHFQKKKLATPKIFFISTDKVIYLQQDFGNISLLNKLEEQGFTEYVYSLFQKSLQQLALLQVKGHEELDYKKCLTNASFGKEAIMADLLYFKYYFLDALRRPYDKQKLIKDFEALSNYLSHTEYKYFMFRDFQSRNIMITPDDDVHFIDYQGGMKEHRSTMLLLYCGRPGPIYPTNGNNHCWKIISMHLKKLLMNRLTGMSFAANIMAMF